MDLFIVCFKLRHHTNNGSSKLISRIMMNDTYLDTTSQPTRIFWGFDEYLYSFEQLYRWNNLDNTVFLELIF